MKIRIASIGNTARAAVGIAGLFLAGASLSHGAVTACDGTEAAADVNVTNMSGYGGATNGCAVIDLSFENLSLVSSTNTSSGMATSTLTNLAAWATGSIPVGNTVGAINFYINSDNDANWDATSSQDGALITVLNYLVTAHSSGAFTGGSYATPDPGFSWFFDQMVLNVNLNSNTDNANDVLIRQTVCFSGTVATCAYGVGTSNTLSALYTSGNTTTATRSCQDNSTLLLCAGSNTAFDILNSSQVSSFIISTRIEILRDSGTVGLNWVGSEFTQFAETPEPGTFGLMGAALVGLGFFSRRRRKR